jgi:hypothetical protein
MKRFFTLLIIILSSSSAMANPPKSVAGLWYATFGDSALSMRLKTSAADDVPRLEEITGQLVTRVSGPSTITSETIDVTGQYLGGTLTACFNFGAAGANRLYGVGEVPRQRTEPMVIRLFRVRPGSGINFERILYFYFKGLLPVPPASGSSAAHAGIVER